MKSNKILVVFVTLFFLTTVGSVSYICYDNFVNKNITNEVEKDTDNDTIEELDINSRLVQTLYNKVVLSGDSYYKYFMYDSDNYVVSDASEESKLTLAYFNLTNKNFVDIGIEELNNTVLIPGFSDYHILNVVNNTVSFIPYNSLLVVYQDLFGSDVTIDKSVPVSIDSYGGIYYVYNESLDGYVPYMRVSGETSASYYTGSVVRAEKSNKEIVVYEEVKEIYYDDTEINHATYVYTFNIDDDGLYSFVSRVKE